MVNKKEIIGLIVWAFAVVMAFISWRAGDEVLLNHHLIVMWIAWAVIVLAKKE